MQTATLLSLAVIGFLGGGHCAGMCGGLSSALALQLPPHLPRWRLILLMNGGRIASYVLIGLLLGGLGQFGISLDQSHSLQALLFIAAHLLLLAIGLYLAGINHSVRHIERLGRPVWKRLNPLLNRLLPIKSHRACLGAGILWGWLPCGMVYSASLYALGSGHALDGGLLMLAFGLGTLPNLLMIGLFAGQLKGLLQHRYFRLTAGLGIAAWAVWQLLHGWPF